MRLVELVGAAALLVGCAPGEKLKEVTKDEAIPVSLKNVEYIVRTEPVSTAGTVTSLHDTRVSFKIGGVIDRIFVREGQSVKAGQLLATLHPDEIDAQVNQAEVAYAKATRDFERVSRMLRDTAATLEQHQNAQTAVDVARENLHIARFNREYAKITSPISGTVLKKMMNEGEVVGPGTPVLMLLSNQKSDWVIRVGVSDRDWARLAANDRAEIELDAYPEEKLEGYVTYLSQAADPITHLYEVEIRLTGNFPRLASGLFARVKLWPSGSRGYYAIPVEALIEGNGENGYVFTVENGIARKRSVKVGYLDRERVLLVSGIDSTDQVVCGGSAFLSEGASVIVSEQ